MDAVRFTTRVEIPEGQTTATMFEVPVDMRAAFGRARPPLRVTVNGHTFRARWPAAAQRSAPVI